MEWIMLLIAGLLEITWAVSMKLSEGFSRPVFSIITALAYLASALFLSMALKKLPLGTAYAMWTGFGIVGTSIMGVILFHEGLSASQIFCILLIVAGIAGLKILGS